MQTYSLISFYCISKLKAETVELYVSTALPLIYYSIFENYNNKNVLNVVLNRNAWKILVFLFSVGGRKENENCEYFYLGFSNFSNMVRIWIRIWYQFLHSLNVWFTSKAAEVLGSHPENSPDEQSVVTDTDS